MTAKKTAKPMSSRKLNALKRSIANWEKRAKGEVVDAICPLCVLYNSDKAIGRQQCLSCPVYERTGLRYCEGTPFDDWCSRDDYVNPLVAKREVRFLKSLLPKEVK